jgi:GTP cyclohydrolase I
VVSLGSNIDPGFNLAAALDMIDAMGDIEILATSTIYESEAVGGDYPPFHNAAVLVETGLGPSDLRSTLKRIEAALGRVRSEDRNAPRTIDLDVTVFGDLQDADLNIPDPQLEEYPFVAIPAGEVAAEMPVPGRNKTLGEIAETMSGAGLRELTMSGTRKMSERDHALSPDEAFEEYGPSDESFNPQFEKLVREQLEILGEDPDREGLIRTPYRVAKAMAYLTRGYTQSLKEVINNAIFQSDTEDMVMLKDIEFYSMCEHHLLPFFGRAHVAYIPNGRVIGVSKLARIVDVFARRMQIQERLANQVADALMECLEPHGVAVVMEAAHLCMLMRGVQKQNSEMVTSALRGSFLSDDRTRQEFMTLVGHEMR